MTSQEEFTPWAGSFAHDDEDVVLVRNEDGSAVILPRSVKNLSPGQREIASDLMKAAAAVQAAQTRLVQLVMEGREEGLSWGVIGFSVGTTGEAARQRWGGQTLED